ncbi:hypothetical protein A5643_05435 [Mycobacterium sp. 1274756.6]|nr:hypothetical protein A5643_05435 [Mycobacterium sp. 1274756.6]
MEPVEINAGAWYLRAPRADDRVDDRVALADLGETDPDYVAGVDRGWAAETRFTWAVCEPTTGELFAEVVLDPATERIRHRHRAGHQEAARVAAATVCRFAAGALGLNPVVAEASAPGPVVAESGGAAAAEQNPGHSGGSGDQHGHT